ncbi:hypothetical protein [Thermogemmatispora sp.]|jgi:hypothetical protein|uniref:hypothetical protein n=1 Tax=Thermogemmatispora sp. TaxID=1968838 RepID=UPI0035E440D2
MLPLFIFAICILLLGGLVVLCHLYLRCGLGQPRLTSLGQWHGRWTARTDVDRSISTLEPIQPTVHDESLLLAVNVAPDETSRQARFIAFLLLGGFFLSILLLLLSLGS